MITKYLPHVGLRTVKTALAVAIGLLIASLYGSETPIFAAIGAISAMGRTVADSKHESLVQVWGTVAGFIVGSLFAGLLPWSNHWLVLGIGVLVVAAVCVHFKLYAAVALASIVFVDISMYGGTAQPWQYGFSRLCDTILGIGVALVINIAIKPYNNRRAIRLMLMHFLDSVPDYVRARVLHGSYPDLSPLQAQVTRLYRELDIYDKQNFPRNPGHDEEAVFLRGCTQLAEKLVQEMQALGTMDESGVPSEENRMRLAALGLDNDDDLSLLCGNPQADAVCNYHLSNLLDAYQYLRDFNRMEL